MIVPVTSDNFYIICERIAGGESLRKICRDDDLPNIGAVMKYLDASEAAQKQYARARALQAEHYADEIVDISDDAAGDVVIDDNGIARMNGEFAQRSKIRIDARKWIAAKLLPKKYGDKIELSGNKESPLVYEVVRFGAEKQV